MKFVSFSKLLIALTAVKPGSVANIWVETQKVLI